MRDYDEQKVRSWYLWNNYYTLLDQKYLMYSKYIVSAPDARPIRLLLKNDFDSLLLQFGKPSLDEYVVEMAKKIEMEHAGSITIQRCPVCNKIVVTPITEQCNWCGSEWRGKNPLRTEWEKSRK